MSKIFILIICTLALTVSSLNLKEQATLQQDHGAEADINASIQANENEDVQEIVEKHLDVTEEINDLKNEHHEDAVQNCALLANTVFNGLDKYFKDFEDISTKGKIAIYFGGINKAQEKVFNEGAESHDDLSEVAKDAVEESLSANTEIKDIQVDVSAELRAGRQETIALMGNAYNNAVAQLDSTLKEAFDYLDKTTEEYTEMMRQLVIKNTEKLDDIVADLGSEEAAANAKAEAIEELKRDLEAAKHQHNLNRILLRDELQETYQTKVNKLKIMLDKCIESHNSEIKETVEDIKEVAIAVNTAANVAVEAAVSA